MGHVAASQNTFSWALLVPVAYKHLSCNHKQRESASCLLVGLPLLHLELWDNQGPLQRSILLQLHPSTGLLWSLWSSSSIHEQQQAVHPAMSKSNHHTIESHTHTLTYVHTLSHNMNTSLSCTRWVPWSHHLRSPSLHHTFLLHCLVLSALHRCSSGGIPI